MGERIPESATLTGSASVRAATLPFAEKVRFLTDVRSYAERPSRISAIETHMSWVFLTNKYAYKLKKPVRYSFLDFSTIAARRRNCQAEVRLNRRLAPGVYLGVVPLVLRADRTLSLGGGGRVVDWLVQMRRLRKSDTLLERIRHHRLRMTDLSAAVAALVRFYRRVTSIAVNCAAYRGHIESEIRTCRDELTRPVWRLPTALVREITDRQLGLVHRNPKLFDDRASGRRILEGHGDLRPEHVYLGTHPVFTDCLEFNHALRIVDCADELAYLALECEMLGAPEVGQKIFGLYERLSHDRVPDQLVHFYMSERACVRARLAIWHLKDPDVRQPLKWRRKALKYLRLAARHARAICASGRRIDATKSAPRPVRARSQIHRREAA